MDDNIYNNLSSAVSIDNTTSLVSLYIPSNTRIVPDLTRKISSEIAKSANIKARVTRQGVQSALSSILVSLKSLTMPTNGVVFFAGETSYGTIMEKITPPSTGQPINQFLYRCDSKFYL